MPSIDPTPTAHPTAPVPATTRAVVQRRYGGPEQLSVEQFAAVASARTRVSS